MIELEEQFELWLQGPEKWELAGAFDNFDVAVAMMSTRTRGVRLVRTSYKDGNVAGREVIADLGATRRIE